MTHKGGTKLQRNATGLQRDAAARKDEDNNGETLTFHPHSLERRSGIAIA